MAKEEQNLIVSLKDLTLEQSIWRGIRQVSKPTHSRKGLHSSNSIFFLEPNLGLGCYFPDTAGFVFNKKNIHIFVFKIGARR